MHYQELTDQLPLRPDCTAGMWTYGDGRRTVFLNWHGVTAEMIDLRPGEEPTAELLHWRARPGQWALVADWPPQ